MTDETLEQIESQLGKMRPVAAPRDSRSAVLADVHRELRASRWDRRLARIAAVLLILGVGMNAGTVLKPAREYSRSLQVAESSARQSLVNTAVVVAEATDARTGSEYARQMAVMIGHRLTADDQAAIDAAVGTGLPVSTNGSKG
jgi:hypothetical protein